MAQQEVCPLSFLLSRAEMDQTSFNNEHAASHVPASKRSKRKSTPAEKQQENPPCKKKKRPSPQQEVQLVPQATHMHLNPGSVNSSSSSNNSSSNGCSFNSNNNKSLTVTNFPDEFRPQVPFPALSPEMSKHPQLVITSQQALTRERYLKNGVLKNVHVVVKNSPFLLHLSLVQPCALNPALDSGDAQGAAKTQTVKPDADAKAQSEWVGHEQSGRHHAGHDHNEENSAYSSSSSSSTSSSSSSSSSSPGSPQRDDSDPGKGSFSLCNCVLDVQLVYDNPSANDIYSTNEKQVDFVKKNPLEYKTSFSPLEPTCAAQISVEAKLKVLTSQLEDMLFRLRFQLLDAGSRQPVPDMLAVLSEPIRVVSKSEQARKVSRMSTQQMQLAARRMKHKTTNEDILQRIERILQWENNTTSIIKDMCIMKDSNRSSTSSCTSSKCPEHGNDMSFERACNVFIESFNSMNKEERVPKLKRVLQSKSCDDIKKLAELSRMVVHLKSADLADAHALHTSDPTHDSRDLTLSAKAQTLASDATAEPYPPLGCPQIPVEAHLLCQAGEVVGQERQANPGLLEPSDMLDIFEKECADKEVTTTQLGLDQASTLEMLEKDFSISSLMRDMLQPPYFSGLPSSGKPSPDHAHECMPGNLGDTLAGVQHFVSDSSSVIPHATAGAPHTVESAGIHRQDAVSAFATPFSVAAYHSVPLQ